MEQFLDWTRTQPTEPGMYYRTTLWGKVIEERILADDSGALFVEKQPGIQIPIQDFDARLYWFGPIPTPGDAWRTEVPRGKGYVVRLLPNGDMRTEYVETLTGPGLVIFGDNGRIIKVRDLEPTLWFGPICKPPDDADVLIPFRA